MLVPGLHNTDGRLESFSLENLFMKKVVSDIKGPHRAFAYSLSNAPVSHTVFYQLFNASFIGTAEQPRLIRHENINQGNGGGGRM